MIGMGDMQDNATVIAEPDEVEAPSLRQTSTLRAFLIDQYGAIKRRLAHRLGSSDQAEDALQDTYLRLDGTEAVEEVRNPAAYLFRAALNIAANRNRDENRRLSATDIDSLLHIADDAPDALQIIEGRADLMRLKQAMAELPPRPRAILLAVRLEGLTRRQIAERFGISVSLVEKDLKKAQEHCAARFGRRKTS
jgi:RNA polymerase sigma-70 factor (ECF subfamily)